jgi:hypothetical protein
LICELDRFWRGAFVRACLWFKSAKLFNHGGDCVIATGFYDLASFEFIGIDIPYELAQSSQMLMSRSRLIVLFDEWYGQRYRAPNCEALIIESDVNQGKFDT